MKKLHRSSSPWEPRIGFARAVRAGSRILVSGTAPLGQDGRTVAGGAYEQARRCFEIVRASLDALGGTLTDVVRTRMYLVRAADAEAVGRAHREAMGAASPAATMVVVAALLDPSWLVEVEAEAEAGPP